MSEWYYLGDSNNPLPPGGMNIEEYIAMCKKYGGESWMFDHPSRVVDQHWWFGIKISTIFLCLDHGFGSGRPVLWETMVFGGPLDGWCERYCTFQEAWEGHRTILRRVIWKSLDPRTWFRKEES